MMIIKKYWKIIKQIKIRFEVTYASFIMGEMRVTNKTLERTHNTRKAYQHSVAIGADVFGDTLLVSIMNGDDTERGVGSSDTFITWEFNLKEFPLKDLNEGEYSGQDFEKLLDIVFRALILSSTEGYKEYAQRNNNQVFYGDDVHYSWITLKDNTKITWEDYDFQELATVLQQQ